MRYLGSIMKFVVIFIIYIILYRIMKTMYLDLRSVKNKEEVEGVDYAIELTDCPESIDIIRGSVYPIHSLINIGRGEDNQVAVNDPFISNHHASIYVKDDRLFIRDMNSTNGTYKNGIKVNNEAELYNGDILKIGRLVFKVIG